MYDKAAAIVGIKRIPNLRRLKMKAIMNSEIRIEPPTVVDHPILLWFKQHIRILFGQSLVQEGLLNDLVKQKIADENVIGVILFGSVASKTHKWQSDIDLIFVYDNHEPPSGLVDYFVSGILVQYFYVTLNSLIENQKCVPYLLHMFSEGIVLFDRHSTVTPIVNEIKQYFAAHPEIESDWVRIKELHQIEKRGSQCQETTIIQRWDELEDKYSGGARKRTFFLSGI